MKYVTLYVKLGAFMQIDCNTGLVLEGGGMRGVFTCGVLDAFMKHDVWFRYGVAVSAGAGNGMSYVSKQPRRARMTNIDLLAEYNYIGLRHLWLHGSIFDHQLLFYDVPNRYLPYDFNAYFENPMTFEIVTTNCLTGNAMYLTEKKDKQRTLNIVRASGSLPYVSRMVEVDGIPMLDGGIVDSIPLKRAIETGHEQNVVVLTRNKGYRKMAKDHKVPHFIYKKYPRLRVALSRRIQVYNEQLAYVEELEKQGKVLCIRPNNPLEVDRIEKNIEKLERLYEEGFKIGEAFCSTLK